MKGINANPPKLDSATMRVKEENLRKSISDDDEDIDLKISKLSNIQFSRSFQSKKRNQSSSRNKSPLISGGLHSVVSVNSNKDYEVPIKKDPEINEEEEKKNNEEIMKKLSEESKKNDREEKKIDLHVTKASQDKRPPNMVFIKII